MNILFYDMGSYLYTDILETMKKMGHTVRTVYYHFESRTDDDFFCTRFNEKIDSGNWDLIFSVNFFPLVAKLANERNLPYVSWSCDSPLAQELEDYFDYDTNYIYLFDEYEVEGYQKDGHSRVFYLPLAVNPSRLSKLSYTTAEKTKYSSDVSFVGSLYNASLDGILLPLDQYQQGYLQGALEAQMQIIGSDILPSILTDSFVEGVNEKYAAFGGTTINRKGLSFAIQKQITFAERVTLIDTLGGLCKTKFYSTKPYDFSSPVEFMGPVKYHTQMPAVFRYSKINLCPTLRSIVNGIPLRSLDILACGGVLLSNYQTDLAKYFVDGEDVIMYTSLEDAVDKAMWYLKNEDARSKIAGHAMPILEAEFSYEKQLGILLNN